METSDSFYNSSAWVEIRDLVRARDGHKCSVGRLLGGRCSGNLHVNHVVSRFQRPDLELDPDNCGTACASHHPHWEAVARILRLLRVEELPPCNHSHPYSTGRLACEEKRRNDLLARRVARLSRAAAA